MSRYSPYGPNEIETYVSESSAKPSDTVNLHVSVLRLSSKNVNMRVFHLSQFLINDRHYGSTASMTYKKDYRKSLNVKPNETPVASMEFPAQSYPVPTNASQDGCGWPASASWKIPSKLASGVYIIELRYQKAITYVLLVVRPARRANKNKILCQVSVNTHQAYNPWGGGGLYGKPISERLVNPISFDRPCQLWDLILYESSILNWFDRNFEVDYCTNVDLHMRPKLLDNVKLFVSCGHDEYWSKKCESILSVSVKEVVTRSFLVAIPAIGP